MQVPLCLETLGDLDNGTAKMAIDEAIRRALQDLDDRGSDGKERKVGITLSIAHIDKVNIAAHVEVKVSLPAMRTAGTIATINRQQGQTHLMFQSWAPDNPEQRTIDEVIKE